NPQSNHLLYLIIITIGPISGHQFSNKPCKEQLGSNNDGNKRQEEQRLLSDITIRTLIGNAYQFFHNKPHSYNETSQEAQYPHGTEKVHRSLTELTYKKDGEQ